MPKKRKQWDGWMEWSKKNRKTIPLQVSISDYPAMESIKLKSGLTWPAILKIGLNAAKKRITR